jgi:WD40 repeat protein
VTALAYSPDGKLLVAGTGEYPSNIEPYVRPDFPGRVWVWDVDTGKVVADLPPHSGSVHAVAFSPDGSAVVSAGADRALRVWDVNGRRPLATLEWHVGVVTAVAFSPDGEILATSSADGTVRLWPWRDLLRGA